MPLNYLMDNNEFGIHVVLFSKLRPSLKAKGSGLHNPFYMAPCAPLKVIDQQKVNSDLCHSLQMMYYEQEPQGTMYSF